MYNLNEFGGTTNLIFDPVNGRFEQCYTSLGRTIRNCAGGPILRAPPGAPLASAVTALAHIP